MTKMIPHIIVGDARQAIDFYRRAFGAELLFVLNDPSDSRIGHAELKLGEDMFMLADEYPDFGAVSPDTIGGTPVVLHLTSEDVDADTLKATAAGATLLRQPRNQSYGERSSMLIDPFGHRWRISQTTETVAPEEMQRRWNEETGA